MSKTRKKSGRPLDGEFAPYAAGDIGQVEGDDVVAALEEQEKVVVDLFSNLSDEQADHAYAPGKWTLRQILGHLIDDERIYAYRLLCIARGEQAPLPGFDENAYVRFGGFETRSMASLLEEYRAVRRATITLLESLTAPVWRRTGIANDHRVSVRGLAFHIAGHELHHLAIIEERYGVVRDGV